MFTQNHSVFFLALFTLVDSIYLFRTQRLPASLAAAWTLLGGNSRALDGTLFACFAQFRLVFTYFWRFSYTILILAGIKRRADDFSHFSHSAAARHG